MSTLAEPGTTPLLEVLATDPRVTTAAWVAETFHIDPLAVLASDRARFRLYVACARARQIANTPDTPASADPPER